MTVTTAWSQTKKDFRVQTAKPLRQLGQFENKHRKGHSDKTLNCDKTVLRLCLKNITSTPPLTAKFADRHQTHEDITSCMYENDIDHTAKMAQNSDMLEWW